MAYQILDFILYFVVLVFGLLMALVVTGAKDVIPAMLLLVILSIGYKTKNTR